MAVGKLAADKLAAGKLAVGKQAWSRMAGCTAASWEQLSSELHRNVSSRQS